MRLKLIRDHLLPTPSGVIAADYVTLWLWPLTFWPLT